MRATVVVAVVCGAIASQLVGAGVQWMRRSGVEAPQGVARVGSRSLTVHDLSASDRARLRELELETFAARYDAAARAATERMVAMAARDERLAPADYVRRELETRRSPPLQESGLGGSPEVSVSPTHARAGFDAWRRFVRARQLSVPASIEPSAAVLESGVASFTRLVDWSVAAGKSGPVRDDVVLAGRELVERLRRRFAVRIEVEAPAQPERTALEVLGLAGPLAPPLTRSLWCWIPPTRLPPAWQRAWIVGCAPPVGPTTLRQIEGSRGDSPTSGPGRTPTSLRSRSGARIVRGARSVFTPRFSRL